MLRKLLPVLLMLFGILAGLGAGMMLKPKAGDMVAAHTTVLEQQAPEFDAREKGKEGPLDDASEYVKLNNQFVVPVVSKNSVDALIVLSLSLEINAGTSEAVYAREPKLRDALLQILFDYANMGGFSGAFTDAGNMKALRVSLTEAAQSVMGDTVTAVLVTDIARQDV